MVMEPLQEDHAPGPERPLGVVILGALGLAGAVYGLLSALIVVALLLWASANELAPAGAWVWFAVGGIVVWAGVQVFASWGLLKGRPWGWWTQIVLIGGGAGFAVVEMGAAPSLEDLPFYTPPFAGSLVVNIVIAAFLLRYLTKPHVRAFCGVAAPRVADTSPVA